MRRFELELDSEVRFVGAVHLLREDYGHSERAGVCGEAVDAGDQLETAGRGDRGAGVNEVALHVDNKDGGAARFETGWLRHGRNATLATSFSISELVTRRFSR